MIRHSKSQRHVDGSELTSLPPNNIQWQSLPLGRDSAAFTYQFVEELAARETQRRIDNGALRDGGDATPEERNQSAKLRGLLVALRKCCTDPKMLALPRLDAAMRALEDRVMLQRGAGGDDAIPALRGEEILQWLRQVGTNGQSGDRQTMNHQTDRSYAVETEATRKVRLAQHG
jgi:hypothetical protein